MAAPNKWTHFRKFVFQNTDTTVICIRIIYNAFNIYVNFYSENKKHPITCPSCMGLRSPAAIYYSLHYDYLEHRVVYWGPTLHQIEEMEDRLISPVCGRS